MNILIEPEAFRYGRCGTARYYAAVCRGLRDAGLKIDIPLVASGTAYQPALIQFDSSRQWPSAWQPVKERLLWWCSRLSRSLFCRKLASGRYDLAILTSSQYHTDFLDYAGGTPFLMVCHDTMRSHLIPGGAVDAWSDPLYRLLYLVRRAARVICISGATHTDLLHYLPYRPDNLTVIPSGNMLPLWAGKGSAVPGLPESYLLFVGSRQVRKNFHGLIRMLAALQGRFPQIGLVCTGRLSPYERDFIEVLGVRVPVVGLDVDDAQLLTLYKRAIGLVFPTFYEGFGLPVLEAMGCGCPVLASRIPSISEVAGDAACLIEPWDEAAWLRGCTRIIEDPEFRAGLSKTGMARAQRFSFDAMMQSFVKCVEAAARH